MRFNHKQFCSVATIGFFLASPVAYAAGLADFIGAGINLGGKLVGSAIEKATEDSPEELARKQAENDRKMAEQMRQALAEIEAQPNLRPIDRERLVLEYIDTYSKVKAFNDFVQRADAQRRAERDKLFTVDGLAGVVGSTAANVVNSRINYEVTMKKAEISARAAQKGISMPGESRAERVLREADYEAHNSQKNADRNKRLIDAVVNGSAATASNEYHATDAAIANGRNVVDQVNAHVVRQEVALENLTGAQEAIDLMADARKAAENSPEVLAAKSDKQFVTGNAFAPDLGKKIWIEFDGSPSQTEYFRKAIANHGHVLAESQDEAEVTYLFQGEYIIAETNMRNGLVVPVGKILNKPSEEIAPPEKKISGSIKRGLSIFMLTASNQNVPKEITDNSLKQKVLLVLARQPKGGKETRVSVVSTTESEKIEAAALVQKSLEDMQSLLGI